MRRARAGHTWRFFLACAAALVLLGEESACHPGTPAATLAPTRAQLAAILAQYGRLNCEEEVNPKSFERLSLVLVSAPLLNNKPIHDCQKLALDKDTYGPLVAVLVGDSLDTRITRAAGGVVLADVINYDTAPYPPLGIVGAPRGGVKLHCLWVQGPPNQPESWKVAIRVALNNTCVTPDTSGPITELQVATLRYGPNDLAHATARWGWDDTTSLHFLGIHCGVAWCEFGPKGFRRNAVMSAGWIGLADEQYLDVVPAASSKPSHLKGRIRPFAALDDKDPSHFTNGVHVAAIILSGDPADGDANDARTNYGNKLKLTQDSTDLILRYSPANGKWDLSLSTNPGVWTQLNRGKSTHAGPGAVRWYWDARDAGLWISCTDGCCSTNRIN